MRPNDTPPTLTYGTYIDPSSAETRQATRVEIEGVRQTREPDHGWGVAVDNEEPEFFSVYLRSKQTGLASCAGDFERYSEAYEYAETIRHCAETGGLTLDVADGYFTHLRGKYDGSVKHRALAMAAASFYAVDHPITIENLYAAYECHLATEDSDSLPEWLQLCSSHENASLDGIHEALEAAADFIAENLQAVADQAIHQLRLEGHAIVRFQPSELHGVEPRLLQNRLVELGNQVIDDLRESDPVESTPSYP